MKSNNVSLRIYQADGIQGFGCYLSGSLAQGEGLIGINIGDLIALVADKEIEPEHVPYHVVECLLHEICHALEDWAKAEFNEEKVEALVVKYRELVKQSEQETK